MVELDGLNGRLVDQRRALLREMRCDKKQRTDSRRAEAVSDLPLRVKSVDTVPAVLPASPPAQ